MSAGCRELVATDEPAVVSKPLHDAIVVEDSQGNGRFSDPPCADESDWSEVFHETNEICDQFIASETGSRRRRWGFTRDS